MCFVLSWPHIRLLDLWWQLQLSLICWTIYLNQTHSLHPSYRVGICAWVEKVATKVCITDLQDICITIQEILSWLGFSFTRPDRNPTSECPFRLPISVLYDPVSRVRRRYSKLCDIKANVSLYVTKKGKGQPNTCKTWIFLITLTLNFFLEFTSFYNKCIRLLRPTWKYILKIFRFLFL